MGRWVIISNRDNLWSTEELTMSECAPFRPNKYMSKTRFEGILLSLCYTDIKCVENNYRFLHISQMEEACNINMDEEFNPSRNNVLDESVLEWFNKYVPGFLCVGRKPHPFSNLRHTICCGFTFILQ